MWKSYVELSRGEEDWIQVKECFVRAFYNYSLYTHLIPNKQTRSEFLRTYLEAIYDVTVRNGDSVLICGKLTDKTNKQNKEIIFGGVLLVPPSYVHGGWECAKDEDFKEAYEKYKLKDIDSEAYENIQKYEEWEYENISKHICSTGVPMWNGIFCAVDPKYAGIGCGSMNYKECLHILTKHEKKEPTINQRNVDTQEVIQEFRDMFNSINQSKLQELKTPKASEYFIRLCHSLSMLSHRPTVLSNGKPKIVARKISAKCSPLLYALSHSRQAIHFHKKNGLQSVAELQYKNTNTENSPLLVNALLFDPLTDNGNLTKKYHTKSVQNVATDLVSREGNKIV